MIRQDEGKCGRQKIEQAIEGLLKDCDRDPDHALVVFSVCLVLLQRLSISRPLALRHAWAMEVYRLADTLAGDNLASAAPNERRK